MKYVLLKLNEYYACYDVEKHGISFGFSNMDSMYRVLNTEFYLAQYVPLDEYIKRESPTVICHFDELSELTELYPEEFI